MAAPNSIERQDSSLTREWLRAARFYMRGRRGVLLLAVIAVVVGLALNWSWLVATGAAPVLIAVLPCAVMCAFGLCFHRWSATGQAAAVDSDRTALFNSTDTCCGDNAAASSPQQDESSDNERRDSNA